MPTQQHAPSTGKTSSDAATLGVRWRLRLVGLMAIFSLSLLMAVGLLRLLADLSLLVAINSFFIGEKEVPSDAYANYVTWIKVGFASFAITALTISLWWYRLSRSRVPSVSPFNQNVALAYASLILLGVGAGGIATGAIISHNGKELSEQRSESGALTAGLSQVEDGAAIDLLATIVFLIGALLVLVVVHSATRNALQCQAHPLSVADLAEH